MSKQGNLAAALACSSDDLLGPRSDVLHRLALRRRTVPNRPVRLLFANFRRGASFIDSVVPFAQVVVRLRYVAVACNPAGFAGTLHRAGQHQRELAVLQVVPDLLRALLASGRQRDVGPAGMGSGKAPFRLS